MSGININVEIYKGNTRIDFISFRTSIQLCSGVGNLEFEIPLKSVSLSPYDEITVYQNGVKAGIYYVVDFTHNYSLGTTSVQCQDGSKKLVDYFVVSSDTYEYPTTTRFHLERILNEVGISYNIRTTSAGSVLPPGAMFGQSSAFDIVNQLVQQSGWYFYFDNNGVMQIFSAPENNNPVGEISDGNEILSLSVQKNSESLRNKAIVWGNVDPETSSPIVAVAEKTTGYEMTDKDVRPIVVSSPYIYYTSDATRIANSLLGTFATVDETVTVSVAGFYPQFNIKDTIYVNSRYWSGNGVITSKSVEFSANGAITNFVLNERCPRLTAFYYYGGYVYVGTKNNGIWRKPIRWKHVWERFNSGISPADYEITDLKVKNGIFACIGNKKLYVRGRRSSSWVKVTYGDSVFFDQVTQSYIPANKVFPCGIAIDSGSIYCIFSNFEKNISWSVRVSSGGTILDVNQILVEGNKNVRGFDIDFSFDKQYISGVTPSSSGDGGFSGFADACNAGGGQYRSPVIYNERVFLVNGSISYVSGGQYYLNIYISEIDLKSSVTLNEKSHSILATGYVGELDTYSEPVWKSTRFHYLDGSKAYFSMAGNSIIIFYVNLSNINDVGIVKIINRPRSHRFVFGNYYLEEETVGGNIIYHVTDYITNSRWISNLNPVPHHFLYQYTEGIIYTFGQIYDQRIIWLNPVKGFMHQVSVGNTDNYYAYPGFKLLSATTNGTIAKVIYQRQTSINTYKYYMVEIPGGDIQELSFTPTSYSSEVVMEIPPTANINIFSPNIVNGAIDQSIAGILTVSNNNEYLYFITNTSPNRIKYRNLLTNDEGVLKFESTIGSTDYNDIARANYSSQYFDDIYERRFESGVYIIRGDFAVFKTDGVNNFFNDCIFIFNLGSPFLQGSPKYFVARKEPDYYHYVGFTSFCVNLECKDDTIITYPLPATAYQMSGISLPNIYGSGANQGIISDLRYSFTGEYGSLVPVISGEILTQMSGYPLDTRGFYQQSVSGESLHVATPISLTNSGNIALSVLSPDLVFETSFSGISPSGQVTRIEAYSYLPYPYLFASVSGDRVRFFQRDGSEAALQSFIDRTNNLPDDWINVIRADELP